MSLRQSQLSGYSSVKRAFDIIASLFGLFVLVIPLAVSALAVRISSPGRVIFRQKRIGLGGKEFTIYKFRTMTEEHIDEAGIFEPGNQRRITKVGKILRSTKLDEFPQLWNVVKGDMSLVGPRPEVRKWVDAYPDRWQRIHKLRPGITDLASIAFRNEEELLAKSDDPENKYLQEILPKKLDMYDEYLNTRSFWGDILIILKTIQRVFT